MLGQHDAFAAALFEQLACAALEQLEVPVDADDTLAADAVLVQLDVVLDAVLVFPSHAVACPV